MKYLRIFETESQMNSFKPNYSVLKGNRKNNNISLFTNSSKKEFPIKISANGDGQIMVNFGMDGSAEIVGEWDMFLYRSIENDKTIDDKKYYAYSNDKYGLWYLTNNEPGEHEEYETIYRYDEGEGTMEIGEEYLSITINPGDTTHKQQVLNYTAGNDQILISDTEILSVSAVTNDGYNETLTSIEIPNSVTTIEDHAFYGCSGLTSVTIPDSVNSIGSYAFEYCTGLTSVTIPNSVTAIETQAFLNIRNIIYHGSAEGSPWGARFLNGYVDGNLVYSDATRTEVVACNPAATSVTIPESVDTIGDYAFDGCGLTSVTIPDSVTDIGGWAFGDCSNLASVTIGNSVTTIGNSAFYGCSRLTNVTIPESVSTIGNVAFGNCGNLTSVTIPDSVTSIGDFAFSDCSSLADITFEGTTSQWIGITKGYDWINNAPATFVQCTDGTIDI